MTRSVPFATSRFSLISRAHLRNVPRRGMTSLDERESPGE